MRIAVTRPEEDAVQLSAGLVRQGHEVIPAPVLQIDNLAVPEIPALAWQAVIITSANSLKALAGHPQLESLLQLPCCCVGPASARAAHELGFADVRSAGGGLKELTALISGMLTAAGGPLLYLSGEVVSGALAPAGFDVRRLVLYRAVPSEALPSSVLAALSDGSLGGVVLYSPRSARIWLELLSRHGLSSAASGVLHYCLSANVAAVLPRGVPVLVARAPDDGGILELTAGGRENPA